MIPKFEVWDEEAKQIGEVTRLDDSGYVEYRLEKPVKTCLHCKDNECCHPHNYLSEKLILRQSLGKFDSKGKLYFTGDIIIDPAKNIGVIFYHTESASHSVNWNKKDGSVETDNLIGYGDIIGNKYANPDLIPK